MRFNKKSEMLPKIYKKKYDPFACSKNPWTENFSYKRPKLMNVSSVDYNFINHKKKDKRLNFKNIYKNKVYLGK